jgi:hypothetical protein
MANIDDKILDAIRSESQEELQQYSEELGLFGLIGESFKGSFRWVVFLAITFKFIFAGLVIYCGIKLFNTTDVAEKVNWLAFGLTAFIVFAVLRLWYFVELSRLSIKREIKRLELQIALLIDKLDAD